MESGGAFGSLKCVIFYFSGEKQLYLSLTWYCFLGVFFFVSPLPHCLSLLFVSLSPIFFSKKKKQNPPSCLYFFPPIFRATFMSCLCYSSLEFFFFPLYFFFLLSVYQIVSLFFSGRLGQSFFFSSFFFKKKNIWTTRWNEWFKSTHTHTYIRRLLWPGLNWPNERHCMHAIFFRGGHDWRLLPFWYSSRIEELRN